MAAGKMRAPGRRTGRRHGILLDPIQVRMHADRAARGLTEDAQRPAARRDLPRQDGGPLPQRPAGPERLTTGRRLVQSRGHLVSYRKHCQPGEQRNGAKLAVIENGLGLPGATLDSCPAAERGPQTPPAWPEITRTPRSACASHSQATCRPPYILSGSSAALRTSQPRSVIAVVISLARLRGRLPGRQAECFGMDPAVVLSQDLAEAAGPARDGAAADLAARNRKMGNGHREAAGTGLAHRFPDASPVDR